MHSSTTSVSANHTNNNNNNTPEPLILSIHEYLRREFYQPQKIYGMPFPAEILFSLAKEDLIKNDNGSSKLLDKDFLLQKEVLHDKELNATQFVDRLKTSFYSVRHRKHYGDFGFEQKERYIAEFETELLKQGAKKLACDFIQAYSSKISFLYLGASVISFAILKPICNIELLDKNVTVFYDVLQNGNVRLQVCVAIKKITEANNAEDVYPMPYNGEPHLYVINEYHIVADEEKVSLHLQRCLTLLNQRVHPMLRERINRLYSLRKGASDQERWLQQGCEMMVNHLNKNAVLKQWFLDYYLALPQRFQNFFLEKISSDPSRTSDLNDLAQKSSELNRKQEDVSQSTETELLDFLGLNSALALRIQIDFGQSIMPNQDLQRRIIQALAMGHFEKLELINCIALNDENLIRLLKNSPDIKELRLINCDNLGEEAIRYIAEKCKELKELHFQSSKLKKLTGHAPFLKSAPLTFDQLEVLDVSGCGSLTKADLVAPNLKHFRARNCPLKMLRISNTPALPGECRLERLDISGAELKDLTLISQVLETLIMEDCSVLASFKIAGQPTCPSLRFVNITNSPFLLQEFGHKEATKKYPKIRELIVAKESFSVIKENWHGPDEVTFCTQLTKDQGIKVSFDLAFLYGMLPRIRKKDFIVSVMKKGLEYDAKFILDFIFSLRDESDLVDKKLFMFFSNLAVALRMVALTNNYAPSLEQDSLRLILQPYKFPNAYNAPLFSEELNMVERAFKAGLNQLFMELCHRISEHIANDSSTKDQFLPSFGEALANCIEHAQLLDDHFLVLGLKKYVEISQKNGQKKPLVAIKKYKDAAFNEKNKLAYTELLITYEQFFDVDAVMESVRTAKDRSFYSDYLGHVLSQRMMAAKVDVKSGFSSEDKKKFKELIDLGANVNFANESWSPFAMAVSANDQEIVKYCLAKNADINADNNLDSGFTPLQVAVMRGNAYADMVLFLIDHGALVDKPSSKKSLWPLLLAFQNKQVLIIEILWNAGANIDLKDKSGRTLREMIFDLSVYPDSDVEYKAFRGFLSNTQQAAPANGSSWRSPPAAPTPPSFLFQQKGGPTSIAEEFVQQFNM